MEFRLLKLFCLISFFYFFLLFVLFTNLSPYLFYTGCVCVSCREANALNVTNCTLEQKQALFAIALSAFSQRRVTRSLTCSTVSPNSYQLTRAYLGRKTHTQTYTCTHKFKSELADFFFCMQGVQIQPMSNV